MHGASIYSLVAVLLAATFGLIGVVQLLGPRFVRDAYTRWDYGPWVRWVTGVCDVAAAIMLAMPALRAWGIAIAALLAFGSVIVFLNHRQYRYALPTIGLMVALLPATIAVPRSAPIQFTAKSPGAGSGTMMVSDERAISNQVVGQLATNEAGRRAF